MLEDIKLADDVNVTAPEEVTSLMNKIADVCDGKQCSHILAALWLSLLSALMAADECSPIEAMDHAQDLIKWTKGGCDESIPALSPQH